MQQLRAFDINTLVLAGGYTEHCITATAYAAFELDFDVSSDSASLADSGVSVDCWDAARARGALPVRQLCTKPTGTCLCYGAQPLLVSHLAAAR